MKFLNLLNIFYQEIHFLEATAGSDFDVNALALSAFGQIQDVTTAFNTRILEVTNRATVYGIDLTPFVDGGIAAVIDVREAAERCVSDCLKHTTIFVGDVNECVDEYRSEANAILDDLYAKYDDIVDCSDK